MSCFATARARHEAPELLIRLGRMRHQDQFVGRVERHERAEIPLAAKQIAKPPVREHPLDEVVPQPGIREAAFLFHRQVGKPCDQPGGEKPSSRLGRNLVGLRLVDLDPLEAAARRVLLEHVAAQVLGLELGDPAFRVLVELVGQIGRGLDGQQPDAVFDAHQAHRFPRRAHAGLHLGADGHPFDQRAERVGEKRVALVAAVIAHGLAEQAGRDADADQP